MRRPTRRAASLLRRITSDRPSASAASPGRLQPECGRVALPGGSAETVLPGALAKLPRGGDALFSPLAGGANEGGFPELACAGVAGAGVVGCG